MPKPISPSKRAVRRFILARSGLLRWTHGAHPYRSGIPWRDDYRAEDGTLHVIHRLEAVQLDPVAVLERNHHLVLRNRVANYRPTQLEALYRQRQIFEYLANARCILPIEDFWIFAPVREAHAERLESHLVPFSETVAHVRERLALDGPKASREFDSSEKVSGYWDADSSRATKKTSQVLEHLWERGEVTVAYRQGEERFFALTDRWFAGLDDRDHDHDWEPLLEKYVRAFGVFDTGDFRFGWRKQPTAQRREAAHRLSEAGLIIPIELQNVRRSYYMTADGVPLLESVAAADIAPDVYFLPPLDNVLWRRERLLDIFEFDYTWEIYRPAEKRRFGPYTMPILEGDRFIGRLDTQFLRRERLLRVHILQLEPDVKPTADRMERIRSAIRDLALDLGAQDVSFPQ